MRESEITVIEYFKGLLPFSVLLSLDRGASWFVTEAVFCSTASPTRVLIAAIGSELFVKMVVDDEVEVSELTSGAVDDDSKSNCVVLSTEVTFAAISGTVSATIGVV